jgi:hypothetical protein
MERGAGADQRRLREPCGDQLKTDRQSLCAEAARQRDCRMAAHIEWTRVSLQFRDEFGLLPQRPNRGEVQRGVSSIRSDIWASRNERRPRAIFVTGATRLR